MADRLIFAAPYGYSLQDSPRDDRPHGGHVDNHDHRGDLVNLRGGALGTLPGCNVIDASREFHDSVVH